MEAAYQRVAGLPGRKLVPPGRRGFFRAAALSTLPAFLRTLRAPAPRNCAGTAARLSLPLLSRIAARPRGAKKERAFGPSLSKAMALKLGADSDLIVAGTLIRSRSPHRLRRIEAREVGQRRLTVKDVEDRPDDGPSRNRSSLSPPSRDRGRSPGSCCRNRRRRRRPCGWSSVIRKCH